MDWQLRVKFDESRTAAVSVKRNNPAGMPAGLCVNKSVAR
jgi:AICAR transformylase/IMP cyclohydrolase PurH